MRAYLNLSTLLLVLLLVVAEPQADERTDFRVNDNIGKTQQNHPSIAVAGDGSFVIAWLDFRSASSDIFLQRFGADGNQIGSNVKVNSDLTDAYQFEPSLAVDLSGLYSIVWKDYRAYGYPFSPDIYFQRYDSSVTGIGSNVNITTEIPDSSRETPDLALYQWGGGVIVWADYRNNNWDIYGQIISSNGSRIGANFKINDDIVNAQQHAPRVTVSEEGWFAVAWYDNRRGDNDIYIQRFDTLANKLGGNLLVSQDTTESKQAFPDIAADGAGHFTVVWVDWQNGNYPSNPDIFARKFDTSLIAITDEYRVNSNEASTAQREPTISADRMGNVAIIWVDSTSTSWDIIGQMVDVDGIIREANFQANTLGDSLQLHPDVALDGKFRYITWADKRSGNFDIYASITRYNDPNLVISPTSLKFEMALGQGTPPAKSVTINHVGYNQLPFDAKSSVSWLSVTPQIGTTPADVQVEVTSESFEYGTYFGSVTFVDLFNNDSTVVLPVRLDVTAPLIELSQDTLATRAFSFINEPAVDSLVVNNAGSGDFQWTAFEEADWLDLSRYAGQSGVNIEITCSALLLGVGTYSEIVYFDAPTTYNLSDSVLILFEVVDNLSFIMVEPNSFSIMAESSQVLDTFAVVANAGVGILNWQATVDDPWLSLDRSSGLDGDSIKIQVDLSMLPEGIHETAIHIIDSSSFNIDQSVLFVVYKYQQATDTIIFEPVNIDPWQSSVMSIRLKSTTGIKSLNLPMSYEPLMITADSVLPGAAIPNYFEFSSTIDSNNGLLNISFVSNNPDSLLGVSDLVLADFYFTGKDSLGAFTVDTMTTVDNYAYITDQNSNQLTPVFIPGQVTVGTPTGINDPFGNSLPEKFSLHQNYPNPFNPATTIEFELPVRAHVELTIFNILGQQVRQLIAGSLPAGHHRVEWDSRSANGYPVASGVYFYRLSSDETRLVKKMVLLK